MQGPEATHAPITELVNNIRRDTGRRVPDVDPGGPGTHARVLMVLRDPGRLGALKTNILSPTKNSDVTAKNTRWLMAEAGLSVHDCLFWNAVPWDLQDKDPRVADKQRGAAYLNELLKLLDKPSVVACGNIAHEVCDIAGVDAIKICHPSGQGLSSGPRGSRPKNIAAHVAGLKRAATHSAT